MENNSNNDGGKSQFLGELSKILKEMGSDTGKVEEHVREAAFEEWNHTFSAKMPLTSVSQMNNMRRLNKPDCEQIKRMNESTSYFRISESARKYFLG